MTLMGICKLHWMLALLCLAVAVHVSVGIDFLPMYNCRQSSQSSRQGHLCGEAIDAQNIATWSETGVQCQPWWEASLGRLSNIKIVAFSLRNEREKYPNVNVPIANIDGEPCNASGSAGREELPSYKRNIWLRCNCSLQGQIVRVQSPDYTSLALEHLFVAGYPAQLLPASSGIPAKLNLTHCRQSTDYATRQEEVLTCRGAIDGRVPHGWSAEISHTLMESRAFWEAQTQWLTRFTAVRITNRQDCCQDRLTNFVIKVDDNVCSRYSGAAFSVMMLNFTCSRGEGCNCEGRVLRIQLEEEQVLTLAEVEAFGTQREPSILSLYNKIRLHNCRQSSTFHDISICTRAIDGSKSQVFTAAEGSTTRLEDAPWWEAKFWPKSNVTLVRIYNRVDGYFDRLTDFVVKVNSAVCAAYNAGFFNVWTLGCYRVGTYLSIESRKRTWLTLMEVEAFGVPV